MLSAVFLIFALLTSAHGFSDELFQSLKYTSYLANNCYCLDRFLLTDPFHNGRYYMEQNGLDIALLFTPNYSNKQISGTGYVALDRYKKQIIVAFRGSVTPQDWLVDFTFGAAKYVPLSGVAQCPGDCRIHEGVYENFKQSYNKILSAVKGLREKHPDYPVVVTGHSLGGGYAYLMGIELQLLGYNPLLVTYGGLRMGNQDTDSWVDQLFKSQEVNDRVHNNEAPRNAFYRVVQAFDIVPLVPPGPVYGHAGLQFTILDNSTLYPAKGDVRFDGFRPRLLELLGDVLLSGRLLTLMRVLDHIKYFRRMAIPCLLDSVALSGRL